MSNLAEIEAKVERGERLTAEDGLFLFEKADLLEVGRLADKVRRRLSGDNVYFIANRHLNPTNVCDNLCPLCAFGVKETDPTAYTMDLDEAVERGIATGGLPVTEVHIVGGLTPDLDLHYYEELLRRIKRERPNILIQAFTAVEIDYLAKGAGRSATETLERLQAAGLDSLPGGGAEVFSPRVRATICPKKIDADRWLEVHGAAHQLGLQTNATMLYGHIETYAERVEHLLRLREQQDQSGGFLTFIPLAFHAANTRLLESARFPKETSGLDDLRTLAVARLLLDNFPHVKAMWIQIGPKLAQVALNFGVDDLDGTVMEERIYHSAGAETPEYTPREELVRLIRQAGRVPVERDTLYRIVATELPA